MGTIAKVIEVVKMPHGNAPESVRKAWVGCRFPTDALECGHVPQYVKPVVPSGRTGPIPAAEYLATPAADRPPWKVNGFSVNQAVAIEELAKRDLVAAQWFKDRGYPLKGGGFRFELDAVKIIEYYTSDELMKLGPITRYDDMETGTPRPMT